jgi:trigger factor
MNPSIENISDTRAKVTVTLTAEETSAQDKAAMRAVLAQARVPGFRPGKAPEALLRKRYAKAILDEAREHAISNAFDYLKEKSGLKVYLLVDVAEGEFVPGKEAAPVFTVDLMPRVKTPQYIGIETKVRPIHVEDKDIDAEIENLRRSRAAYNKVEREVRTGDYVKLSYKGTIDGQPIDGMTDKKIWGTQENTWEEAGPAGPNSLGVPAIVEGIVGMKVGEEKDLNQEFEANHEAEELRGKKGVYHVSIHEVRERVLPELNAEFLKSINAESVEKLRESIKTELTNQKNYERHMAQREQVAAKLLEAADFEVPVTAVENETNNVLQRIMIENMQRGVSREEFEEHKEELHAKAAEIALMQARRNFVLAEIATEEKLQVTNEDINRAITVQAMRLRMRPEDFVKELTKDRDAVRDLQRDILMDKTIEIVVTKAKLIESEDAPAEEEHDHKH